MSSDPERLSTGGSGDLQALLAAGKTEVPDGAQMMALAAKIALIGAAGAGGAGGAGAAGAAGGASAGAKATATAGAAIKTAFALKVIGAVAVISVAGTTAVVVTRKDVPPPAPMGLVATTATATGSAQAPALPVSAAASAPGEVPAEPASASSPAPSAEAPRPKATAAPESAESEVRLLERAQDALRSRPDEALALCSDHAKRFPRGMLVQEREVIAIEALVKLGRKSEARARADRFESRYPGSTHTRRLETLLAD